MKSLDGSVIFRTMVFEWQARRTVHRFERELFSRQNLCSKLQGGLRSPYLVFQNPRAMNITCLNGKARQPQTKEVAL